MAQLTRVKALNGATSASSRVPNSQCRGNARCATRSGHCGPQFCNRPPGRLNHYRTPHQAIDRQPRSDGLRAPITRVDAALLRIPANCATYYRWRASPSVDGFFAPPTVARRANRNRLSSQGRNPSRRFDREIWNFPSFCNDADVGRSITSGFGGNIRASSDQARHSRR